MPCLLQGPQVATGVQALMLCLPCCLCCLQWCASLAGTMIVTGATARTGAPNTQIGTDTIPAGMAAAGMTGTPAEGTMLVMTGVIAIRAAMTADAAAVQLIGIDIDPTPGTDNDQLTAGLKGLV